LVRIIDNRLLIMAGFGALAFSIFQFAAINLNIGVANIVWPNIVNGMAISFIFVPLTTMTMGGLRNDQIGTGTGIFNLMRNLGGSVGIATATTLLTRGAQIHQAVMVSHLSPYNPLFQQRLHEIQRAVAARLGSVAAVREAYGVVYSTLLTQATLAAFVDNFRLLAFLCLCGVPLVLLLRRVGIDNTPLMVH
jgi:DHA2 family multidrug resistance protein